MVSSPIGGEVQPLLQQRAQVDARGNVLAVGEAHSLRDAADHMVEHNVGRLVALGEREPRRVMGIDLLAAHARRLRAAGEPSRYFGAL